jgi:pyruvate dehydrogenase E2 component (dihydrolipoamide acetyltransferase)
VLAEIRVVAGDVAPVGAVVAVIAGAGEAMNASAARQLPLAPAKAGAQGGVQEPIPLDSRLRGNERKTPADAVVQAADRPAVPLDPFFEVRTPARNFGPARLPGGIAITPLARRLAGEAGIDLSRLRGSGPHGRIVAADIQNAPLPSAAPLAARAEGPTAAEIKALYAEAAYDEVPLDAMRRTIAARLTQAQAVPHFHLTADVEIGRLIALREEANAAAGKDADGTPAFKLSLNDFVIRALALALQRVPGANAVWAGDRILRLHHSDIGVAVALDDGLITPVIRSAETKSVGAIAAEMKELAGRAREKKLKPADYRGGSSAVSNLGMYGVREFSAIINPPHATILAIGAARRQAVETADGGTAFASMLTATLSCDHRVVDGALGAQLLAAFKSLMEAPVGMLL